MKNTERRWPSRITAPLSALALAGWLAFCLVGCTDSKEVSREAVGKIVDANLMPTSFNESIKTQVKTERRYLVVYGTLNCPLGAEAYLVSYDDGRTYFTWDGARQQYFASR